MPLVSFIIPVRHQDNARDWPALRARLEQTVASIANQDHPDWNCVIVANEGADLPDLPPGFAVERVTFPPNDMHELNKGSREAVLDAFRYDKGRRVLAGMLAVPDARYFMIVDDDDLVHSGLVSHVAQSNNANGWFIDKGYLWDEGGRWFLLTKTFDSLCGTCLIIRSDLYGLPPQSGDADIDWIKVTLGSHVRIKPALARRGTPLAPLPFAGAAYRVGSAGSHSQAPGILKMGFLNPAVLRNPRRLIANLLRLRWITPTLGQQFFGAMPPGGS